MRYLVLVGLIMLAAACGKENPTVVTPPTVAPGFCCWDSEPVQVTSTECSVDTAQADCPWRVGREQNAREVLFHTVYNNAMVWRAQFEPEIAFCTDHPKHTVCDPSPESLRPDIPKPLPPLQVVFLKQAWCFTATPSKATRCFGDSGLCEKRRQDVDAPEKAAACMARKTPDVPQGVQVPRDLATLALAHTKTLADIETGLAKDLRNARWKACRRRADFEQEKALILNCRSVRGNYSCRSSFLSHEKDLHQQAWDACDRACPTCMVDE